MSKSLTPTQLIELQDESDANALLAHGSTAAARERYRVREDRRSRATRGCSLPQAVRELTYAGKRTLHITPRKPRWAAGDRVEVERVWRRPAGSHDRDPDRLDPALDILIHRVERITLGELTHRHAQDLGVGTVNAIATEWLDARQPGWRHPDREPKAHEIKARWGALAEQSVWITTWTAIVTHETRQLPKPTSQRDYVEEGGLHDEGEAVDPETLAVFATASSPGIVAATEDAAAAAVAEVDAQVDARRKLHQQRRTKRREALKRPRRDSAALEGDR